MEKVGSYWRTIAIIAMVLFVLETLLLVWLFSAGAKSIENENICAVNICGDDKYTAYYYDDYTEVCSCFEGNDITLNQVITGNAVKN